MKDHILKKYRVLIFVIPFIILTVIAAILHLNTRHAVAEGSLRLVSGEKEVILDISKFEYKQVTGVRVNGKGEEIPIDAPGVSLMDVVSYSEPANYEKVTVVSDDSYYAELSAEEVKDDSRAFLILDDEKKLRLVVFGDANSKRSVTNVVQITVE